LAIWDAWSQKSKKYDVANTNKEWNAITSSPPTRIGAGTIFYHATEANADWETNSWLAELSKLDKVAYDQRRKPVAKELGIRASTLDSEVERHRAEHAPESILYDHWKVEPWPDPVDTEDLLAAVTDEIERYVATLDSRAVVVALWVMFTWVHDACTHSPILLVTSPEPDSGKTTLLGVISYLAWRPVKSVNITGPMLYRSIQKWSPTIIIDEADTALKYNDDLRAVINSGWTRGDGVVRGKSETHEPQMYTTFAPKGIGMKGKALPDTTLSRTIQIELKPKLPDEQVYDFQHTDDPTLADLRSMLARWAADNIETLRKSRPRVPPSFNNRLRMNWRPLFAIANLAGVREQAWQAALAIEQRKDVDPSLAIKLLADIREIYHGLTDEERDAADGMLSRELVAALIEDEEKPWAQLYKGKPLTRNRLARMLRAFGISSEDIHKKEEEPSDDDAPVSTRVHAKGYKWVRFKEAWTRYLENFSQPPKTDP
jgi:putative DNA primase/helicase